MLDLFVKSPDPATSHQALTNFIGSQSQTASSTIINCLSCFFKSLHWLSLLYMDLCLKIRSRPSAVTTRSSNYFFLEVPRSKKLAFCVSAPKLLPSRMFQAWTPWKLNWNHIYIHILSCLFPFCVDLFAFSGIYFDFICFLYCILRSACILRKRRFINADIVLYYCLVVGSHYSWKKHSLFGGDPRITPVSSWKATTLHLLLYSIQWEANITDKNASMVTMVASDDCSTTWS